LASVTRPTMTPCVGGVARAATTVAKASAATQGATLTRNETTTTRLRGDVQVGEHIDVGVGLTRFDCQR
jgi:hypothetical protein